jgi:hypothetical protein
MASAEEMYNATSVNQVSSEKVNLELRVETWIRINSARSCGIYL